MVKRILKENLITNCKVTHNDLERALYIYGTSLTLLQGKIINPNGEKFDITPRIPLPPSIATYHCQVILGDDFIFVNGMPFLHTKSKNLVHTTCHI